MNNSLESNEQLYSLQLWLSKYWKLIAIIVVLFLIGFAGLSYYKYNQQVSKSKELEQYYTQFLTINETNLDAATKFAENNHSFYATNTSLSLAKYYAKNENYDKALSILEIAKKNTNNELLLSIINIRIARLQIELKQYDNSLLTLNNVTSSQLKPLALSLKGDIYLMTQQYGLADQAYQEALSQIQALGTQKILNETIEMKLNEAKRLQAQSKTAVQEDNKMDDEE